VFIQQDVLIVIFIVHTVSIVDWNIRIWCWGRYLV